MLYDVDGVSLSDEDWEVLMWAVRRATEYQDMTLEALRSAGVIAAREGQIGATIQDELKAEEQGKVFKDLFAKLWPDEDIVPEEEKVMVVMP